jgi:hypothetical protein
MLILLTGKALGFPKTAHLRKEIKIFLAERRAIASTRESTSQMTRLVVVVAIKDNFPAPLEGVTDNSGGSYSVENMAIANSGHFLIQDYFTSISSLYLLCLVRV